MSDLAPPPFGAELRRRRLAAGLTQEELAERSGVSARSVSDFERGAPQRPRRDTVALLAEALRLDAGERRGFLAAARAFPANGASSSPGVARRDDLHRTDPCAGVPAGPGGAPGLPVPPTPLIGREDNVATLTALLERTGVRLVTVTGPAGVGKTRLAVAVAERAAERGEVRFVPLAAIRDATLVLPTVAQRSGLQGQGRQTALDLLSDYVASRPLTLILDNCEQVLAAAPDIAALLAACPRLKILATSRAPLRVRGEHEWAASPLVVPCLDTALTEEQIRQSPAVALFVACAQAVRPDFELDAGNARLIALVCARLDGLPLAIELAAPLLRIFPLEELHDQLAHPLPRLAAGPRDLPDRHQTLRGAIAWSHDLLTAEQQALFRRLAVFSGGFTLAAARAVCAGAPNAPDDTVASTAALVEHSLVRTWETTVAPRFTMLETIRHFALERLNGSGELAALRRTHANYFLAFALTADAAIHGPDQLIWQARLLADHDNMRAALDWAIEAADADTALRLAGALGWFWRRVGYLEEGQRRLEAAIALPGGTDDDRANALNACGSLARDRHDLKAATRLYAESLALARRAGGRRQLVGALLGLGGIALVRGDASSVGYYTEAQRLAEEAGLAWEAAGAKNNLAMAYRIQGRLAEAAALARAALDGFGAVGDVQGVARASYNEVEIALESGNVAAASTRLEEILAAERALGDAVGIAQTLVALAAVHRELAELPLALAKAREAMRLGREVGHTTTIIEALEVIACIAAHNEQRPLALRLFATACQLRERYQAPKRSVSRIAFELVTADVVRSLGVAPEHGDWAREQALTIEEAMAEAATVRLPVSSA